MSLSRYAGTIQPERLIRVAGGQQEADLVLKNARVLSVFTQEIVHGDVAVVEGVIAGIGHYDAAAHFVDLQGDYVVPGFINTHCHVESSMVSPDVYCKEELRHGTTTVITDPHEIANVAGIEGIRYMLETAGIMPINYFVQAPSCVPATPFEHAGAELNVEKIKQLLAMPGVLGLGEMMNYPGVLDLDSAVLDKLSAAHGRVVDGHAPALSGNALQAYVAAGIDTDHESTSYMEAIEKLRAGIAVLVREGSACKDLEPIISGVVASGIQTDRLAFCTDDKHIADIRREGTIRHCIRRAIDLGMPATYAYAIASYHAAKIFGLQGIGAIAPGYRADFVVIGDLNRVEVKAVYKDGRHILADTLPRTAKTGAGRGSVNIAPLTIQSFLLAPREIYPVIGVQPYQVATKKTQWTQDEASAGLASGQLCKLAVIERHHGTGNVGVGLLAGYGLQNGAVASTVGHDSHNLIVAGTHDADMLLAARKAQEMQGGYVYVSNGEVVGSVPLSVYGLMSDEEPESFIVSLESLIAAVHAAGVPSNVDPFITLSFLALPVIPEIRLTDIGVFDVTTFKFL